MQNISVGIFDSGLGGLTVLNQLVKKFPNLNYYYYGDSGRAPYGNRSREELLKFNYEIITFLRKEAKIDLLIMACNTSCAMVLDEIREKIDLPIIDLISSTAKRVNKLTYNKKICVLATQKTVETSAYKNYLLAVDSDLQILQIACPELVPIVENNKIEEAESQKIAIQYFERALNFGADTLIYGCSHYPYFEPIFIKADTEQKIKNFVDPAKCILPVVQNIITPFKLENKKLGQIKFWISGDLQKFKDFINNNFKWENTIQNFLKHKFK